MAKYRPIDTRLWHDRKFLSLSDDARLLWVFLLTAPSTLAVPGVIVAGEASIAEQLGWTVEKVQKLFAELFAKQLSVRVEGRLLWLTKALKYQSPRNPKMLKGWATCWDDIPECALKMEIWQSLKIASKSWSGLFAKLFREPFPQLLPKQEAKQLSQEQDQEQDQDQENSAGSKTGTVQLEILKDKVDGAVGDLGRQRNKNADRQRVIDAFHQRFKAASGESPTWGDKTVGQVGQLLKKHSADTLIARINFLFDGKCKWLSPPYTLGTFVTNIDSLVEQKQASPITPKPASRQETITLDFGDGPIEVEVSR